MINYYSHPNCMPTLFSGCQFNFVKTQKQPEAHLISAGNVKFIGCAMRSYGKCLIFQTAAGIDADSPSIEFDNCDLGTTGENAETSIYTNAFTVPGGEIRRCSIRTGTHTSPAASGIRSPNAGKLLICSCRPKNRYAGRNNYHTD